MVKTKALSKKEKTNASVFEALSKDQLAKKINDAPFSQPLSALYFDKKNPWLSETFKYSRTTNIEIEDNEKDKVSIDIIDISKKKKKKKKKKKEKLDSPSSKKTKEKSLQDDHLNEFTSWLNRNTTTSDKYKYENKEMSNLKDNGTKNKKSKNKLKRKIESSISKNKEIATISLAQLYVEQGYYKKAIDMYEKLRLKNPKKNSFFAAEIEKVKIKSK